MLERLDWRIFEGINQVELGRCYDLFFEGITWFGSLYLVIPILLALGLVRRDAARVRFFKVVTVCLVGTGVVILSLKPLVDRPRPTCVAGLTVCVEEGECEVVENPPHATQLRGSSNLCRQSFPSGHCQTAFAWLLCVALLWRDEKRPWPGWVMAGCLLLASLVAASRMVLGVHYPSDVVSGSLLGAAGAWLSVRFVK
ncbi:MAG: hypothetical protein AUK47_17960 [Deltaproteobacteria bacterium CG2_30_63_29]|nr:phosphatase PAP2 family protein [Armatimonadota bacterium]OIP34378.1 MAG: hypothetical protein AUK47_17960 [Deltaproteobacteria bacterium CG2_30_63_29]PJB46527.1 MAG: hypothetical protein CO108_05725 [Deltaproteobacteria bacterium CG_4_9_14_3_um_filter_63_12]